MTPEQKKANLRTGLILASIALVFFLGFMAKMLMMGKGEKAPQNPWEGAEGLEWEIPSPAPFHTFETPPKLNAAATKVLG